MQKCSTAHFPAPPRPSCCHYHASYFGTCSKPNSIWWLFFMNRSLYFKRFERKKNVSYLPTKRSFLVPPPPFRGIEFSSGIIFLLRDQLPLIFLAVAFSQRYIHLAFVYGHVFILNAFILKIFSCWVKISRLTNFLLLVLLQQLSLHCLLTSVTSSGESSVILIFPLFAALLIYFFPITRFYKFDCYVSWYGSL